MISLLAIISNKFFKKFVFWETSHEKMTIKSGKWKTLNNPCLQSRRIEEVKIKAENNELISMFKRELDVLKKKTDSDIKDIKSELHRQAKISSY